MKIAIIDYGLGNLRSVEKAFHHVGASGAFVTDDPELIKSADKAVLPGDGAFDSTVDRLQAAGVDTIVKEFVATGKPFLGICVGMQVLFTESDEGLAGVRGLDLVAGRVRKFSSPDLKVPQIGWNQLSFRHESPLFAGLGEGTYVYFLHSYYCDPSNSDLTTAICDYGVSYCAALQLGNVYATQFHPEKSGEAGLKILTNFANLS